MHDSCIKAKMCICSVELWLKWPRENMTIRFKIELIKKSTDCGKQSKHGDAQPKK